jgi:nucleoid-associated protein YgaU
MESAEFWNKLLPDLCDNSNRKIIVRARSIFQENMSRRRIFRGKAVTQPGRAAAAARLRSASKDENPGQMPQLPGGHTLAMKRGKNAVGPFFF